MLSTLKCNDTLRRLVYRIDFQYIVPDKQVQIVDFILEAYGSYFDTIDRIIETQEESDKQEGKLKGFKEQVVFAFRKECVQNFEYPGEIACGENLDGLLLKLANTYLYLEINLAYNAKHFDYNAMFAEILKKLRVVPMFRIVNFGYYVLSGFFIPFRRTGKLNKVFNRPYIYFFKHNKVIKDAILDTVNAKQRYFLDGHNAYLGFKLNSGYFQSKAFKMKKILVYKIQTLFNIVINNSEEKDFFIEQPHDALIKMEEMVDRFYHIIYKDMFLDNARFESLKDEFDIICF